MPLLLLTAGGAAAPATGRKALSSKPETAVKQIFLVLNLIGLSSNARRDCHLFSSRVRLNAKQIYMAQSAGTARRRPLALIYGTLITVFTIVTDAFSASTRPFSVVTVDEVFWPGLEIVIPGIEIMVPTIVPPPP